jgi:phosphoribosyl 1,2-cyclic phosphodiesterase
MPANHDPEMLLRSDRPPKLQHRILSRRGHLSNQDCVALLPDILGPNTRHLILAHLSDECNDPRLARRLAATGLERLKRTDITLNVAEQDRISPRFELDLRG